MYVDTLPVKDGFDRAHRTRRERASSISVDGSEKKYRATRRGKMLGWGSALLLAATATGAAIATRSNPGRYNSALTQNAAKVGAEIATGQVDPNAVTEYTVPRDESAYDVASGIEGHKVDASDPVIGEAAAQAGGGPLNNGISKGTRLVIQRNVFPSAPPSLVDQARQGKL